MIQDPPAGQRSRQVITSPLGDGDSERFRSAFSNGDSAVFPGLVPLPRAPPTASEDGPSQHAAVTARSRHGTQPRRDLCSAPTDHAGIDRCVFGRRDVRQSQRCGRRFYFFVYTGPDGELPDAVERSDTEP